MLEHVRKYIQEQNLLAKNDTIIIGVSGGADSVALLDILFRLNYSCVICHCNFHLRAEESLRDELFVYELALSYQIPFIKIDFDTKGYAHKKAISIEMAARELRYDWFEEQRKKHQAAAVAIAHHQNDSVETVLLNLTRGTGIRGLTGIRPKNEKVIRPLLPFSKEEILEYLAFRNLSYVTDSTNFDSVYTRNFIRNKIIPLFEELNPEFNQTVQKTSEYLHDSEAFYLQAIQLWIEKTVQKREHADYISIPILLESPSPKALLFEILSPFAFNSSTIKTIYEHLYASVSGKEFYNTTNTFRLIKDREYLILTKKENLAISEKHVIDQEVKYINLPIPLTFEILEKNTDFMLEKNRHTAYFDFSSVRFPLHVRRWKPGDWFVPFGMTGRKKVSDYFTDQKFSLFDKENAWLLCSADDEILWIINHRSDNRYRIKNETKQVLKIIANPSINSI